MADEFNDAVSGTASVKTGSVHTEYSQSFDEEDEPVVPTGSLQRVLWRTADEERQVANSFRVVQRHLLRIMVNVHETSRPSFCDAFLSMTTVLDTVAKDLARPLPRRSGSGPGCGPTTTCARRPAC